VKVAFPLSFILGIEVWDNVNEAVFVPESATVKLPVG
jgi:hypothetical protein